MLVIYNLLLTVLAPLWVPWMLFRAWQRKEQPNWKERQGDFDLTARPDRKRVWVHAVSVGEVIAATPILRELRDVLPDHEILLSTTTSSGHRTAREHAVELYDHLVYFPIDVARFQIAAMIRARPAVAAIMETELWMNFLWAAKNFDARTMLVNGRISDRSFGRAKFFKFFYRAALRMVDRCLMQTDVDAERIRELGAPDAEVVGNTKFDQALEGIESDPESLRADLGLPGGVPVIVIGSTRGEAEERFVVEALKAVGLDRVAIVHAPRHIERARDLAALYGGAALRSRGEQGQIVVLDSYGELDRVYAVADVVVIGGGFENFGGQNLIQPLAHGKPVLHGPHMQNFREAAALGERAGSTKLCSTPDELAKAITHLLENPDERRRMGEAARKAVRQSSGAARRYAEAIAQEARRFHEEESKLSASRP